MFFTYGALHSLASRKRTLTIPSSLKNNKEFDLESIVLKSVNDR